VTVTIGSAPGAPPAPTVQITHPTCLVSTGSFTITSATGGFTYSLDGTNFAAYPPGGFTGLQPGPHTLQVKNVDGCTNSVTVTINAVPPTPAAPTVLVTDPTCGLATGSFVVTSATAGLTFSLDGGTFTAYPASGYTGLNSGSYQLEVMNSEGCTSQVTVTIGSAPGAPPVPTFTVTEPTCALATGSFVVTSATAGLTFSLNGSAFGPYPAAGYSGLNTGDHILIAKNIDGCTSQVTVTIGSAPGAPPAPAVQITHPTCLVSTGSFTITSATGGFTYSLDGTNFAAYPPGGFTGLQPGPHTLQVKNVDGCTNSVTVTINAAPPTPAAPTVLVTDPTCGLATGSFVITSATAGLTFSLDGGPFAAYPASGYTGLNSGSYQLEVMNSEGCTSQVTVTIGSAPGAPPVPTFTVTEPTCALATGSFVVTSATAGLTFSLNGSAFGPYPAAGYSGLNTGDHILIAKNIDGCTSQVTVTIGSAPGAPPAPTVQITHPTCLVSTGSFTITSATGGFTYSLDGTNFAAYPPGGFTGLQPGPHTLQVKNVDGCTNSVTVTINACLPRPLHQPFW
jgi:large repetitive protein